MNNQKIALLTGVTGFIGAHLAEHLLDDGWTVHCLIRSHSKIGIIQERLHDRLHVHYLLEYNENLNEIMASVQPVVVFHLASLFLAQHEPKDITNLIFSNVTFGTQLVDAMVKNNVYYLVNTGTSWQHYQNAVYSPVCLYAATKEAFATMLKFYEETTDLQIITLKLFDTYGKHDIRPKLFTLLHRLAVEHSTLDMSAGEQYIDLVHVDDVVAAFILAAEYLITNAKKYRGEYAVSSLYPIKLRDLVVLYEKIVEQTLNINWGARPYRPREVMVPWNTGRILPNWTPKIPLEEGIRDILK